MINSMNYLCIVDPLGSNCFHLSNYGSNDSNSMADLRCRQLEHGYGYFTCPKQPTAC